MRKNALVVSGGGSKGAFAVGAIDHIVNTLGIQFQFISGTSTGALIAPLVVTGNIDVLKDIYTSVRTRDILLRRELANILRSNSIFDVSPLDKLVRDTFDQARTAEILASNTQMALTTVCLQTGRVTYFQSGPTLNHAQDVDVHTIGDRETLRRAVIASADQPVLMPPVMIPSGADPPRQYVDGGVREYAPIRIAIDNGATDVYAIVLGPEDRPSKDNRFQGVLSILMRTLGVFIEDVGTNDVGTAKLYNDSLTYLNAVRDAARTRCGLSDAELDQLFSPANVRNPFAGKRLVNLHIVRPATELPSDGLEFDPPEMTEMMARGKTRARAILGSTP